MNDSPPLVPDAPNLPGLSFRHFRGESDVPSLVSVHEGCRERDQTDPFSVCYRVPNLSLDEYQRELSDSLSDGSGRNIVLAGIAGSVIAHGRLEWWNEWNGDKGLEHRAYLVRAWVLPEWRNRGIGTALLHWGEERARALDMNHAAPGELATNASDGEADAISLLHNEGYRLRFLSPELAFDDLTNLPPLSVPPGFEITPLQSEDCPAVARALIEANADPNLSRAALEEWISREEPGWTSFVQSCEPGISRIGWANGEVAGLHLCRRRGPVGDIANVAVRPAFRMRGLARSLMFHCLHAIRDAGLRGARLYTGIGTDRDAEPSGPYRMYLGFGFRLIAFHNRYRKAMPR